MALYCIEYTVFFNKKHVIFFGNFLIYGFQFGLSINFLFGDCWGDLNYLYLKFFLCENGRGMLYRRATYAPYPKIIFR